LNKTRGVRPAGIFGKITEKETGKILDGVVVTIQHTDRQNISSATGRYEVSPLAAGTYVAVVEKAGYQPVISGDLIVKTGKLTRWNVALEPVLVMA
jgi:Carboxypeptidase regulatory-like domain